MPLAFLREPFDHPDWIFEPKLDGFRALATSTAGSANWSPGTGMPSSGLKLRAALGAAIPVEAVLDGEIVNLGEDGAPRFYNLMRRRTPQFFYAFDLVWLNGKDLRQLPL